MTQTEAILNWYWSNKRDLPWRKTNDPYAVLVSEMMLQQTRVDTVISYYHRFIDKFPDVNVLAQADETEVLAMWQGLGYYSRARNLHKLAKQVAQKGSVFPDSYEGWRELPGVGPYIAGAVMSIAYNIPQPAVDGNVLRVISRIDASRVDIMSITARKEVIARVMEMIPEGHAGDFTQALMELGALVCKPTSPNCEACPVKETCKAYIQGVTDVIPVKKPKKKPITVKLYALAVCTNDSILLEKRKDEGLLAKMWGLPVVEKHKDMSAADAYQNFFGAVCEGIILGHITHGFTHQRWEMEVVLFEAERPVDSNDRMEWIRFDELKNKPIPTAFKKVLGVVSNHKE